MGEVNQLIYRRFIAREASLELEPLKRYDNDIIAKTVNRMIVTHMTVNLSAHQNNYVDRQAFIVTKFNLQTASNRN